MALSACLQFGPRLPDSPHILTLCTLRSLVESVHEQTIGLANTKEQAVRRQGIRGWILQ